jgi:hypothetical protein
MYVLSDHRQPEFSWRWGMDDFFGHYVKDYRKLDILAIIKRIKRARLD